MEALSFYIHFILSPCYTWDKVGFWLLQENGLLHVPKDQAQNPQAQMFSDPNMAMDMMKKNLSMIIPQV